MRQNIELVRPSSDHQRNTLKIATRRGLRLADGGGSFQYVTRVKDAALSKYAAIQETETFMPIDVALDLDMDIEKPVILAALAMQQGYGLVKINASSCKASIEDVATIVRSTGEVVSGLCDALDDGEISILEAVGLSAGVEEALDHLRCLQSRLMSIGESKISMNGGE